MVNQKKNKNGICVFCGVEGKVTDDHVPPKNLFKGFPDNELIKVPSCLSCNNNSSKDDEYFRAFIIPQEDIASHPQAQKLNKIVRKKFDESEKKGLEIRMTSQLYTKDIFTPTGIYLGERNLIYPEYSRIDSTLKKIIKGLFFHLMKKPFPSEIFHIAVVDKNQIEELQRILTIDLNSLLAELDESPINDIHRVFSFKCVDKTNTLPKCSVWLLTFFEKRQFFGLTYPKKLGPEVNLIDFDPNDIALITF